MPSDRMPLAHRHGAAVHSRTKQVQHPHLDILSRLQDSANTTAGQHCAHHDAHWLRAERSTSAGACIQRQQACNQAAASRHRIGSVVFKCRKGPLGGFCAAPVLCWQTILKQRQAATGTNATITHAARRKPQPHAEKGPNTGCQHGGGALLQPHGPAWLLGHSGSAIKLATHVCLGKATVLEEPMISIQQCWRRRTAHCCCCPLRPAL